MATRPLNLKDRSHNDFLRYLDADKLVETYRDSLGKHTTVTSGRFEMNSRCHQRDLDWNHMDQHHRPWIHRTYLESVRIALANDFAVSLTKLYLWKFPVLVNVTDVRLDPGFFYQTFTILGIFYIHVIVRHVPNPTPEGEHVKTVADWHIVSHSIFGFLHGPLNRRLLKLNEVQNLEDVEIRERRADLRARGYGFSSDEPDFVSSNALTLNTRPPRLTTEHRISILDLKPSEIRRFKFDEIEILVQKNADGGATVWPGVCPHEGADLSTGKVCGRDIRCSWHGLRFAGTSLTPQNPTGYVSTLGVTLDGENLILVQASEQNGQSNANPHFVAERQDTTLIQTPKA